MITEVPTASASGVQPSQTSTTDHEKKRGKCKNPVFFGLICLDGYEDEYAPEL
jgi:hypothetical protein